MSPADAVARDRLERHDHGTLATVHQRRGVDAVPVVYAVHGDHVGIPIDRVKPKASATTQRERNLVADPRAVLLIEYWDPVDWSRLWWVRAHLRWEEHPSPEIVSALSTLLAAKYTQYHDEPFARVLVLRIAELLGWAATPP